LSNYRIIFILLSILLFFACESSVNNASESDEQGFNISGFSINYNNEENKISIYVEISDSENIASINSYITRNGDIYDGEIIFNELLIQSSVNSNIFLYEGSLELSNEIYIYDIALVFNFNNESPQGIFLDTFSTPIKPEIIGYIVPDTFQLDPTDWTWLPIDIEILNLNGFDNIESVSYQVQRIYNGCDVECNYDPNCNDSIEDSEYQSDPTWFFEYVSSYNINQNHLYQINIPMRPLDGSELLDEDGNTIFPSSDCGRIGTILFKFIVLDQDGLIDEEFDIPLEITE